MHELFSAAAAVCAALLLRLFAIEIDRVRGQSMLPNIRHGDWLLVSPLPYLLGRPKRFDCVICFYPHRRMRRIPLPQHFVKRVVGLPGETVAMEDGVLLINGLAVDEPFLDPTRTRFRRSIPETRLGADEYFVLGDNRDGSNDSRSVGALPKRMLRGKVVLTLYPKFGKTL